jgi:hypothetical protein
MHVPHLSPEGCPQAFYLTGDRGGIDDRELLASLARPPDVAAESVGHPRFAGLLVPGGADALQCLLRRRLIGPVAGGKSVLALGLERRFGGLRLSTRNVPMSRLAPSSACRCQARKREAGAGCVSRNRIALLAISR